MDEDNLKKPDRTPAEKQAYTTGWAEARAEIAEQLGMALRCVSVMGHPVTGETVSDEMTREIFSLTFGTKATIDEFGRPPTGDVDIEAIMAAKAAQSD